MNKNQHMIVPDQVNVTPPVVKAFVSESTTLDMEIVVYPYDASKAAAHTEKLLADAHAGKPLRRLKGTNDLATKACALRGRKPSSGKAWASKLAASLTSPND